MELSLEFLSYQECIHRGFGVRDMTYLPEYADFKKRYYHIESWCAVFSDQSGRVVTVIPFQDDGSLLTVPDRDYTTAWGVLPEGVRWDELFTRIRQVRRRDIDVRLLTTQPNGLSETTFVTFLLPIQKNESDESLWARFRKKTRNELRNGLTHGFVLNHTAGSLPVGFLELYRENMQRHGTPPKSDQFFVEMNNAFGSRAVWITAHDTTGNLAGAQLLIRAEDNARLLFHLSRTPYWSQYINNVLYWSAIQYVRDQGLATLDFGGGLVNDTSHHHFKIGFGGMPTKIMGFRQWSLSRTIRHWFDAKRRAARIRMHRFYSR